MVFNRYQPDIHVQVRHENVNEKEPGPRASICRRHRIYILIEEQGLKGLEDGSQDLAKTNSLPTEKKRVLWLAFEDISIVGRLVSGGENKAGKTHPTKLPHPHRATHGQTSRWTSVQRVEKHTWHMRQMCLLLYARAEKEQVFVRRVLFTILSFQVCRTREHTCCLVRCTSALILAGDAFAVADKPRFLARAASRFALAVPTALATFCLAAAAFLLLALAAPPAPPAAFLPDGVAAESLNTVP